MTETQSLIARLEQATGPDRELDAAIDAETFDGPIIERTCGCTGACIKGHPRYQGACVCVPRFTASIDAALTLVKASNAGFVVIVLEAAIRMWRDSGSEDLADLPRFIVIAALRQQGDA